MYKLQGHSLTRGPWFLPESQSLSLTEKGSTSSITMPMDSAVQIQFNDWLYDEDVPGGDPIVWRVKSISESNNTNTVTVELEHVIRLLEDQQIFGEVTTEDISGGTTCTARQAIEYLLSGNFDWQLGALEVNNSLPYEFETLSVYDAIESVTDTLEGVYWEYDLTQHPFVLNVRLLEMDPDCEMREGRNLSTLKRSVSRTGMYTRIYPIGENDLHIPGDYISNNEEIYGRIDKVVTDSTKTTIENLGAWAHGLLMHNSDPDVTITISGLELSEATNEPMDRLRLNRFCRCPLPEYATTIIERITKLYWKDLIKDRESVTVTLANNMKELSEIIKTESNKAGGGSGAAGQAKQNYLFQANGEHLLYEVFDENGHLHGVLRMTSESLRIAFENLNESTRSEFRLTSESLRISFENEIRSTRSEFQMTSESLRIHFENEIRSTRSDFEMTSESLRIQFENDISSARSEFRMTSESLRVSFENGISSARSEFQMTAQSLRVSFENEISSARSEFQVTAQSLRVSFENDISSARSAIQATADAISAEVTRATGAEGSLSGRINVAAGRIDQIVEAVGEDGEVTAASITVAINEAGDSEAWIDANHVWIGNSKSTTVIAGKLNASDVTADFLSAKIATIPTLRGIAASFSGNVSTTSGVIAYQVYADGNNISNPVMETRIQGPTSNVYTLQHKTADGTWHDAGTFSRATTLSGAWSGATFTVTASPQGATKATTITLDGGTGSVTGPDYTVSSFISHKAYVNVKGSQTSGTATVKKILVDATSEHTAGYNSAKVSAVSWSGNKATFSKSTSGADSQTLTVEAGIAYNSTTHKYTAKVFASSGTRSEATSGTEAWDGGVTAGYNSAKVSAVSWSGNTATFSKSTSGADSQTLTVEAGIAYNSTTHKYTAKVFASSGTRSEATSGTEAYDAGYGAAKVSSVSWSDNVATFSKSTSGANSQSLTVEAAIAYDSSTHKYTAKVLASSGTRHETTSGTEAWDGGVDSVTASDPERQSGNTFSESKKTVYFNVRSTTSTGKVGNWKQVSADVTDSYEAGQDSITSFSIWKGDDNVSGDTLYISPTGSVTLQEWHKKSGDWVAGTTVTVSGNASFYGNTTLYYKNLGNNQYYSAGSHNWYYT